MDCVDLKRQLEPHIHLYDFPTDVLVETIAYCNLKCIMCPQSKLTRPTGVMSSELWKKTIDEIAEKSPTTRIWPALMGEPLLDKQIFARLKYAKDKGIRRTNLNSNLQCFSETMLDDFFACGVDSLYVGIDAFTRDTYARIRVGGKLDVLMRKLALILNERDRRGTHRPEVCVQFIVMDENEHEEEPFVDYWKASGLDVNIKVRPRLDWSSGVPAWSRIRNVGVEDRVPCTWLLRQMGIYWDGRVPQCDADWDGITQYGNINDSTIEEIWLNRIRPLQRKHLDGAFGASPLCPTCDEWKAGLSQLLNVEKRRVRTATEPVSEELARQSGA
ncbi:MAG: radical SAM protein [Phycisphaerae bacterium]|nr:radical SAM protein [Phycisphaerae bacterium]